MKARRFDRIAISAHARRGLAIALVASALGAVGCLFEDYCEESGDECTNELDIEVTGLQRASDHYVARLVVDGEMVTCDPVTVDDGQGHSVGVGCDANHLDVYTVREGDGAVTLHLDLFATPDEVSVEIDLDGETVAAGDVKPDYSPVEVCGTHCMAASAEIEAD